MKKKNFITYTYGKDLTFIELERKTINNQEYILVIQKQKPNLVFVGEIINNNLHVIFDEKISAPLLKEFTLDTEHFNKSIYPFVFNTYIEE